MHLIHPPCAPPTPTAPLRRAGTTVFHCRHEYAFVLDMLSLLSFAARLLTSALLYQILLSHYLKLCLKVCPKHLVSTCSFLTPMHPTALGPRHSMLSSGPAAGLPGSPVQQPADHIWGPPIDHLACNLLCSQHSTVISPPTSVLWGPSSTGHPRQPHTQMPARWGMCSGWESGAL